MATSDLKEAIGQRRNQDIDQDTFLTWQESFCPTAGTCSMMGTANTRGCFLEAAGLAPFGSATMLTFAAAKVRQARDVGEATVELVRRGLNFRSLLGPGSLANGVKYVSVSGGSTNAVLHLMALARRLDMDRSLAEFDRLQTSVPVVAKFKPSSAYNLEDYHAAGGVPTLLKSIARHLDLSAPLAMGGVLGHALEAAPDPDGQVIHRADDPLASDGCFGLLYGSLAPAGAVVKKTGV